MDRQMLVKIKNMPSEPISGYVVARLVRGELWYYGTWREHAKAEDVANEFENGILVGYYELEAKGEVNKCK